MLLFHRRHCIIPVFIYLTDLVKARMRKRIKRLTDFDYIAVFEWSFVGTNFSYIAFLCVLFVCIAYLAYIADGNKKYIPN